MLPAAQRLDGHHGLAGLGDHRFRNPQHLIALVEDAVEPRQPIAVYQDAVAAGRDLERDRQRRLAGLIQLDRAEVLRRTGARREVLRQVPDANRLDLGRALVGLQGHRADLGVLRLPDDRSVDVGAAAEQDDERRRACQGRCCALSCRAGPGDLAPPPRAPRAPAIPNVVPYASPRRWAANERSPDIRLGADLRPPAHPESMSYCSSPSVPP